MAKTVIKADSIVTQKKRPLIFCDCSCYFEVSIDEKVILIINNN